MDYLQQLVETIELHSVEGIAKCFQHGISPNDSFRNAPLIYELISEYTRTPRFKDCVQVFADHGLQFEDKILLAVLLDDAPTLTDLLRNDAAAIKRKYTLPCAYTPLYEATLLHICAEFNHLACAEILVQQGADINARAGADEYGFGGQTPVFHTVNQNGNQSADVMQLLISHSANLQVTVAGITWGKGYPWETLIPAVNPISYAMMGLLPQMHRDERTIAAVVSTLLKAAYEIDYTFTNIPNAYLAKG